jgi:hypothetical protein
MTPDNARFAIAAYTLAAIVYLTYSTILVTRERALRDKLSKLDGQPRG